MTAREDAVIINSLVRQALTSMQEVMGDHGLNAVLKSCDLEKFIGNFPPVVITMDADLQDDPAEIPSLIEALGTSYDLISGWKKKRFDPLTKTIPSKFFNYVTGKMTGIPIHDFNCGLKAYRNEVVKDVQVYGELHRYIPALAHWVRATGSARRPSSTIPGSTDAQNSGSPGFFGDSST